jgi:hypothetical protein
MKLSTLLILFFISANAFAQSPTTTLEITIENCQDPTIYVWRGVDTITIYKYPEDSLLFTILRKDHRRMPITLNNMPTGAYTIRYRNIFLQQQTQHIQLASQQINAITLCPQNLLEYPQNTLAKLKNNDSISISYHSQGCFHTTSQKLILIKKGDSFIAELYAVSYSPFSKSKKAYHETISLLQQKKLDSTHIRQFIRFENELPLVTGMGCTTTDAYTVTSKYWKIMKIDGSCDWNGYHYLLKSIFGIY